MTLLVIMVSSYLAEVEVTRSQAAVELLLAS